MVYGRGLSFRARVFWAIFLVGLLSVSLSLFYARMLLGEKQMSSAQEELLRECRGLLDCSGRKFAGDLVASARRSVHVDDDMTTRSAFVIFRTRSLLKSPFYVYSIFDGDGCREDTFTVIEQSEALHHASKVAAYTPVKHLFPIDVDCYLFVQVHQLLIQKQGQFTACGRSVGFGEL